MESTVKDPSLAAKGHLQIEWASKHMPVLKAIDQRFSHEKPLNDLSIGACLHVTKETAVLIESLLQAGARVALCGSNPLSTQDDVAAALAEDGVKIFAWREQTKEEYYSCLRKVADHDPLITLDDGADLVSLLHSAKAVTLPDIKGGTEETTTGVSRLRAMANAGVLRYPIIAVNDAHTKHLFDNRYGTGQSTLDGIFRATNILLAGKNFVVCGYGWCGKGIAARADGMGANVIITEIDPIKALEAVMDGYRVMTMKEAASIGDVFVTATGDIDVVSKQHMQNMKDGVLLANSGHFNVEVNSEHLEELAGSKRIIRPNLEEYTLRNGRRLYLLAQGRLVNLAAAEGHPSEVMDLSFSNQALCVERLAKEDRMQPAVYRVPTEIDERVARLKLDAMRISIDELSEEQKKYIASWQTGTS